ncbi:50S ribosomal protein L11 methyltransferase, partial [uncultured Veillonella sp.]
MQWIEISIVCERVATDEVTTLFDDYADNGIIEEDVEDQPNLIKLTMYADLSLDMDMIKADLEKRLTEDNIKVISIDTDILDESTWLNSWQQYIEPTEILPNLVIKP